MERLRHVGNTLRAPAATSAFEAWAHSSLVAKHEVIAIDCSLSASDCMGALHPRWPSSPDCAPHHQADRIALLRQSETLEAKLSLAHYELGQLALHKAAQDDELGGLRKRCAELSEEAKEHAALVTEAAMAKSELAELQVMASDCLVIASDCI